MNSIYLINGCFKVEGAIFRQLGVIYVQRRARGLCSVVQVGVSGGLKF